MRKLDKVKLEFFYLKKAFFNNRLGFKYIKNKFFLAPKILKYSIPLDKEIKNYNLSVHILSCHSDLVMLCWSLFSFYQSFLVVGQLYIHSDGSLTENDQTLLKRIFPQVIIIKPQAVEKYLEKLDGFPEIRKYRFDKSQFFLMKKLIDPYLVSSTEQRLVIDSDLLWFKQPQEIEAEIAKNSEHSLMMTNNTETPVFFKDSLKISDSLARYNSGVVLYNYKNFNLQKLENYLVRFDPANKRNNQFIEQAGYATCLENLKALSKLHYNIADEYNHEMIMKHYTSPKRVLFYAEGLGILKNKIKL